MLRLNRNQPSLWESILPPKLFQMGEELAKVYRLLDDERFFAPFRERFYTRVGRPTIPIATYLRMMYLKHRYQLGYETLVKEINDSSTWRYFCRLSLEDRVPDDTTLIKLTHKYGEDALRDLNEALVLKLKERKVIRGKKLRLDTTMVEADIHYPTDTGLLADGIRVITRTVTKLKKVVGRILRHLKDRGVLQEPVNHISVRKRQKQRPYAVRRPKGHKATQPGDLVQLDTLDIRPLPGVTVKHFTAHDVVTMGHDQRPWSGYRYHRCNFLDILENRMPFLVRAIQIDGGSEFEAIFEEECQKRGIKLFVLPPRSPKLNGGVERAHRTHTEEFYEVTESSFDIAELRGEL